MLSQFVGGMAAPLFLLLAGLTLAFQMDSQDRRGLPPARRYIAALRRAGYILALAYLFRLSNWMFSSPLPPVDDHAARRHPELHGLRPGDSLPGGDVCRHFSGAPHRRGGPCDRGLVAGDELARLEPCPRSRP